MTQCTKNFSVHSEYTYSDKVCVYLKQNLCEIFSKNIVYMYSKIDTFYTLRTTCT